MQDNAVVYFDGLCEPNPGGIATCGYVVETVGDTVKGCSLVGKGNEMSNNVAEYHGAIIAMKKATEMRISSIVLKGDSLVVINQLRGQFQVRAEKIFCLSTAKQLTLRAGLRSFLLNGYPEGKIPKPIRWRKKHTKTTGGKDRAICVKPRHRNF